MNVDTALELINQILMTKAGRNLRPPEVTIIEGIWNGLTYAQMADASAYSTNYLMRDIGPKFWRQLSDVLGEPTSKTNIRLVLDRWSQSSSSLPSSTGVSASLFKKSYSSPSSSISKTSRIQVPSQDWQPQQFQAPQLSGRTQEVQTLLGWIRDPQCRLIGLGGLSGIGKTSLLRTLVPQLQERFEVIHWRSLQQGPQVSDVLASLLPSSG
ncbi:MAG: hypothetical protein F6K65_42185, partial [Moorea sp. SIO3C2]|nr:hypothetical protein [Moorena sp. SIO3C2]